MMRGIKCTVLYCCRALGIFAAARRMTRDKLRILCYHGFELQDESAFRPKLFMKATTFEQRMRTLAASGLPVLTLTDAVRRLYARRLPAGATVITIDDGFYSVREVAAPVLRRLGLPSTLYVSTYYVQKQTPIFQMLVQYILWKARKREVRLDAPWVPDRPLDLGNAGAVERFTDHVVEYGNRCGNEAERQAIARDLAAALDVDLESTVRARTTSLLSVEELRQLESEGMAVEMHTHRHRFNPRDAVECRRELQDNARVLEQALGRRPVHFCYPSGVWERTHWEPLAESGVMSATTCDAGLNDPDTPRFALRRFLDSEIITQIEFEAELAGLMELLRKLRAWFLQRRGPPVRDESRAAS